MSANVLETEKTIDEELAAILNGPKDAANWRRLDSSDYAPAFDYVAPSTERGECTRESKWAYRQRINDAFNPVNRA